jgi:uncharacterized protein YodC (DUF2158 family)
MKSNKATDARFKVGDCVQLRTGGTEMTVERLLAEKCLVACVWIDARDRVRRAKFPPAALYNRGAHSTSAIERSAAQERARCFRELRAAVDAQHAKAAEATASEPGTAPQT